MRFESETFAKGTREGGEKTHTRKKTQEYFLKTMWKISLAWSQNQLDIVNVHLQQSYHAGNVVENAPVLKTSYGLKL